MPNTNEHACRLNLTEREIDVPAAPREQSPVRHFARAVSGCHSAGETPVRFAVTRSDADTCHCEIGVLTGLEDSPVERPRSVFEIAHRKVENTEQFNAVLLVPTGIGAEIGGHAGDAGPVARLLASACDHLITHPNVVNASDINELPENGLYVEGSLIARLLMGTIGLQKVRANRVLLVLGYHPEQELTELDVNAASAARATLGLDCPRVITMDHPVRMEAGYSSSGVAVGRIEGLEGLLEVLLRFREEYEAVAISSVIEVPEGSHQRYFETNDDVNPWGGVEAMLTHAVSMMFDVPSAHSPMMECLEDANLHTGVVDPRKSAEAVSTCFLHCILKGLHRAPRVVTGASAFGQPGVLTAADVSCLVIPDGCIGLPTLAALEQGIPVIAVRENRNRMRNDLTALPFVTGKLFMVDNYLEAVGVMTSLKAGVSVASVRRPLAETKVTKVTVSSEELVTELRKEAADAQHE